MEWLSTSPTGWPTVSTRFTDEPCYVRMETRLRQEEQLRQMKHGVMASDNKAAVADYVARTDNVNRKAGMLNDLRGYVRDNRDLIFSIVFVLVLDEYVFKGAFRERLRSVIEGVLKRVENKTGIDIPGV